MDYLSMLFFKVLYLVYDLTALDDVFLLNTKQYITTAI